MRQRIVDMRADTYRLDLSTPLVESGGTYEAAYPTIIELVADDGSRGFGEIVSHPIFDRDDVDPPTAIHEILNTVVRPLIVNAYADQISLLNRHLKQIIAGHHWIHSGIDIALHDLLANIQNIPISGLLGGNVLDALPVEGVGLGISAVPACQAAEIVEEGVKRGYRYFEIKVGTDLTNDMERVRAVRDVAGPDAHLKIDANGRYRSHDAIRMLDFAEGLHVQVFEQPVNPANWDALKRLSRRASCIISIDEGIRTERDVVNVARYKLGHAIHLKPAAHGGFSGSRSMANVARALGLEILIGPNVCSGVGMAAMHSFAFTQQSFEGGVHGSPLDYLETDIVQSPLQRGINTITYEPKIGLGLSIDRAKHSPYLADHSSVAKR